MQLAPRWRRWLIAAVTLLVLFTVTGFFILPPIIRSQAEKRLSAFSGRKVTIGKISLNPYTLSITIEKFDVQLKEGNGSGLSWDRLYVNFDALGSLFGEWVVSEVELDGAHHAIVIRPDGTLNSADLIERFVSFTAVKPGDPPPKPSRPIRVVSLKVNSARLEFWDQSRAKPFKTVLGPMTFAVTEFHTVGSRGAPYHFEATTESGEKLDWTGTLSDDPLESRGKFAVENLILNKYTPYIEDKIQADLTDGKLSVSGQYEVGYNNKKATMTLMGGEVHLRDLKISERASGQAAVELPAIDVTGIDADAIAFKATVSRVSLAGGHLAVRREKDGSINLLNMLQPVTPTAASNPATPAMLPDALVKEVELKDLKLDVTDLMTPHPAQLGLSDLKVSLKNATLADGAVMPLSASFTWAPQGTVQLSGNMTLKPELSADLKNEITGFAILPLSPYLEQFVNARITQGAVTTSNTMHLALSGGVPAITLTGDVTVEKFGLVDGLFNEELAGFAGLSLKGLKASTSPQLTVSLEEVAVTGPYARIILYGDSGRPYTELLKAPEKHVNLLALLKAGAPVPAATAAAAASVVPPPIGAGPAPDAARPKVEIGRVIITGGDFSFNDRAIQPNVRIAVTQFDGTIAGLSSEKVARADVNLKGMVDGSGPVAITGKLDPLGAVRSVDLKIDFKNVDLVPLSPYAGKFAGYELARGQLLVDMHVTIADRKLNSTSVVTLNQFTFGAGTNSPDATGLPVRLGVALLKDGDGRIVIDMPVQGNLDDPDFRYRKVVFRVLGNVLAKAATSPFSLLGSMFGGGGDELAFQEFAPGESQLLPAESPKLDTLVKALTNRPALNLGIEGDFDAAADGYALKRQKLAVLVRHQIWEAKHAANPNIPPPDQLEISDADHAVMIKQMFDAKFPPGTQFGTPLPSPPAAVPPPPPPPSGFFSGVWHAITFKKQRDESAAKKETARLAAEHEQAVATATAVGLPLAEMTGRLAETMTVDDNDLRALATARAQRVREQLITTGHIAAERLFLSASTAASAKQNKGPRVFLSLQ